MPPTSKYCNCHVYLSFWARLSRSDASRSFSLALRIKDSASSFCKTVMYGTMWLVPFLDIRLKGLLGLRMDRLITRITVHWIGYARAWSSWMSTWKDADHGTKRQVVALNWSSAENDGVGRWSIAKNKQSHKIHWLHAFRMNLSDRTN